MGANNIGGSVRWVPEKRHVLSDLASLTRQHAPQEHHSGEAADNRTMKALMRVLSNPTPSNSAVATWTPPVSMKSATARSACTTVAQLAKRHEQIANRCAAATKPADYARALKEARAHDASMYRAYAALERVSRDATLTLGDLEGLAQAAEIMELDSARWAVRFGSLRATCDGISSGSVHEHAARVLDERATSGVWPLDVARSFQGKMTALRAELLKARSERFDGKVPAEADPRAVMATEARPKDAMVILPGRGTVELARLLQYTALANTAAALYVGLEVAGGASASLGAAMEIASYLGAAAACGVGIANNVVERLRTPAERRLAWGTQRALLS